MRPWYQLLDDSSVATPALMVYPDRIRHNIREMIRIAGDVKRLIPHTKTVKCPEILQMLVDHGIRQCKCATIPEAEIAAEAGMQHILLAYPLTGPHVTRFLALQRQFPAVAFGTLVDSDELLQQFIKQLPAGEKATLLIDINDGMNRTGIPPGDTALQLIKTILQHPSLQFGGLHVYDGHLRQPNFEERCAEVDAAYQKVLDWLPDVEALDPPPFDIIAGGTPTFPCHARQTDGRLLSPGTILLWDYGYSSSFQDLPFQHAAVLLTRAVSHPDYGKVCLDLGHKSVASEMPHPRAWLPGWEDLEAIGHSEEHLVLQSCGGVPAIGEAVYAVPIHICPTVALHEELLVVENGIVTDAWKVAARKRKINF